MLGTSGDTFSPPSRAWTLWSGGDRDISYSVGDVWWNMLPTQPCMDAVKCKRLWYILQCWGRLVTHVHRIDTRTIPLHKYSHQSTFRRITFTSILPITHISYNIHTACIQYTSSIITVICQSCRCWANYKAKASSNTVANCHFPIKWTANYHAKASSNEFRIRSLELSKWQQLTYLNKNMEKHLCKLLHEHVLMQGVNK